MEIASFITNEHYWSFFLQTDKQSQNFLIDQDLEGQLLEIPNNKLNVLLGNYLQKFDPNTTTQYGVEIKANGSSRSSRIPLVRFNETSQTIWKFCSDISKIEKNISDIDELEYFLRDSRKDISLPLPRKVILITQSENEIFQEEYFLPFLNKQAVRSNILFLSSSYLFHQKEINIDEFLLNPNKLFFLLRINGCDNQ